MSAAALEVYDGLRAKGVRADEARKIAEGVDAGREQDRQQAREYADRAVAQSEEKGKATFVSKDQAAQFATRGDVGELRDEMNTRLGALESEIHRLNRLIVWVIISVVGFGIGVIGAVCVVGALVLRAVGGV